MKLKMLVVGTLTLGFTFAANASVSKADLDAYVSQSIGVYEEMYNLINESIVSNGSMRTNTNQCLKVTKALIKNIESTSSAALSNARNLAGNDEIVFRQIAVVSASNQLIAKFQTLCR